MRYIRLLLTLALLSAAGDSVEASTGETTEGGKNTTTSKPVAAEDPVAVCEWQTVAPQPPGPSGAVQRPEPARGLDEKPDIALQEEMKRQALAASLPRRERELKERRAEDVKIEVARRAKEFGVSASAEEMYDLLLQRAWLELNIDKCKAAADRSDLCQYYSKSQEVVEQRFKEITGVSAHDFKSGRQQPASSSLQTSAGGQVTQQSSSLPTTECACDIYIYNSNRWINRWWALECSGHGGHGVCSGNVDVMHSAGEGAMTGSINFNFGAPRQFECPDDSRTCFKGPTGDWKNVCNCDTAHAQFYSPTSTFYGGDLADNEEVYQFSLGEVVAPGDCGTAGMLVEEHIVENDPVCCDDPLGTLAAPAAIGEGWNTAVTATSFQNCNGGSQSGAYPYCGTFGATIRVTSYCVTRPAPETGSCKNNCGGEYLSCSCRGNCIYQGNCCEDFEQACCDNGC